MRETVSRSLNSERTIRVCSPGLHARSCADHCASSSSVVLISPLTPTVEAEPALAIAVRTAGLLERLEQAQELGDVVLLNQQAGALAGLARAARVGLEQQNELAAVRVRAQHRAGTLLRQLATEHRPGRAKRSRGRTLAPLRPQLPRGVLKQHAITGEESSRWQSLASVPLGEVEARLGALQAAGVEITTSEFVRRGRASLRKRSSRRGASPTELRLRAALTNLMRIPALTTPAERQLAEKIARRLRDWSVREAATGVVAVCMLCDRERQGQSARKCACGGAWVSALR